MEEAFHQAILDQPEDETTWLVLADWLEENARTERAELLRLRQRLLSLSDGPDRGPLEDRLRALLEAGVRPPVPELTNSLGMRFALIPPGRFMMGSPEEEEERYADEGPRHEVVLTRAFHLGVFPVTQEQYQIVMGDNPSSYRRKRGTKTLPVECISFNDALGFCAALGDLPGEKKAGRRYTLPTEAQWEFACRAGTSTPFYFGRSVNAGLANLIGAYGNAPVVRALNHPTPVGKYPANAFGLYDMHGNVWEWCLDRYSNTAYRGGPRTDPTGPKRGRDRVLRGGGWSSRCDLARSADRGTNHVDARLNFNGFRVVLVPPGR
jgi:uncharacterized protein (TIGR02996 family)